MGGRGREKANGGGENKLDACRLVNLKMVQEKKRSKYEPYLETVLITTIEGTSEGKI